MFGACGFFWISAVVADGLEMSVPYELRGKMSIWWIHDTLDPVALCEVYRLSFL